MKKLLLSILIALLILLVVYIAMQGIKIGNLEILGINGIKEKNDNLELKLQQATKLTEVNYKQAINDVQESIKRLSTEKKNYEDLTILNAENDGQITSQIQKYEIETLWVTLGNHATSEGAILKMEVAKGSNNTQETYNLRFTVTGSYISITDFISDIENDTTLGFKIENFKMLPSKEVNTLQATFQCNDIYIIDVDTTTIVTDTTTQENTNSTNNNQNNTSNNNVNNTQNNTVRN